MYFYRVHLYFFTKRMSFILWRFLAALEEQLRKSESLFEAEQLILKAVLNLAQIIMKQFLENLNNELMKNSSKNYQVVNLQPKTSNFCFGPVTFQHRYYKN